MVLLEIQKFSKLLARSHVASINQRFHIIIQNDSPLFDGFVIADFEQSLARQLGDIWIEVPDILVERVKLRVPLLKDPALIVLRKPNHYFIEDDRVLAAIHLLLFEGRNLYHHSLDVVDEFSLLHLGFCFFVVIFLFKRYFLKRRLI